MLEVHGKGARFRDSSFGLWVEWSGFRVEVEDRELIVEGRGLRISGKGFGMYGAGFRVQGGTCSRQRRARWLFARPRISCTCAQCPSPRHYEPDPETTFV